MGLLQGRQGTGGGEIGKDAQVGWQEDRGIPEGRRVSRSGGIHRCSFRVGHRERKSGPAGTGREPPSGVYYGQPLRRPCRRGDEPSVGAVTTAEGVFVWKGAI